MTDLPPGATIAATGVKFEKSLRFNDWRDFVEQLQRMSDRLAWALGDAWLEAGVYRIDYHDGVERLRRSAPDAARCAEVAGQVETSRRREGLSFTHHALVTSLTPNEQDNWLDDAERQGWSVKELRDALGDRKTKRVGQRPAVHLTAAEPEPPGDSTDKRMCVGGCGRSLAGKRPHATTCGDTCRKRKSRLIAAADG